MSLNKTFAQARKDLKDAIIAKFEAEKNSGTLTDIKSIIYGDRAKIGEMKTPSLWILPASYIPEITGGTRIIHNFTYDIVALVNSNDPERGCELAEDIAARAFGIIVSDRKCSNTCDEIIPIRIDPAFRGEPGSNLYWCSIQFIFRVQIYS